jgi:hypothetical protein
LSSALPPYTLLRPIAPALKQQNRVEQRPAIMKDASTSPRHPSHPSKYQRGSSPCPAPIVRPARSPLLALPLELLHRILDDATDDHPQNVVQDKSSSYDPRDHEWWDAVAMDTLIG